MTQTSDYDDSDRTIINCWLIYPNNPGVFDGEDTLLIRQEEETEDVLRGNVTHREFGVSAQSATIQKENIVGWKEKAIVIRDKYTLMERLARRVRNLRPDRDEEDDD